MSSHDVDYVDAPEPRPNRGRLCLERIKTILSFKWLRSPLGWLKLAQLALALLGLFIMSGSPAKYTTTDVSTVDFFYFVLSATFMMVLFTIIMYLTYLFARLPELMKSNIAMVLCCFIATFIHIVASAVVVGKFINRAKSTAAAGAIGIISGILFFLESLYYFIKMRRDGAFVTSGAARLGYE